MKTDCLFTLLILFVAVTFALPIYPRANRNLDKGKGRAIDPPTSRPASPPPSRPQSPSPAYDSRVPLPGREGVYTDPHNHLTTVFYGDDKLHDHMGHLQRNQAEFSHNRDPMRLMPSGDSHNRNAALRHMPHAPGHPVTGSPRVRDEKTPNVFKNPRHSTSNTVEYLDAGESEKEGYLLRGLRDEANRLKKQNPKHAVSVQLRPNPGWLPLHPDQHRGHEAPARLQSQMFRPGTTRDGQPTQPYYDNHQWTRPPTTPPPQPTNSNFRKGAVLPPGQRWHPNAHGPSHAGAPPHLDLSTHNRHPPRPQNHEHYMKQQQEKLHHGLGHATGTSDGRAHETLGHIQHNQAVHPNPHSPTAHHPEVGHQGPHHAPQAGPSGHQAANHPELYPHGQQKKPAPKRKNSGSSNPDSDKKKKKKK